MSVLWDIPEEGRTPVIGALARFSARYFDLGLLYFGSKLMQEPILTGSIGYARFLIILLLWMIIEPMLLSLFGYTPGKWLFRISVRNKSGEHLSYMEGLNRYMQIVIIGFGLTIPGLNVLGHFYSFRKLVQNDITSWDRYGKFIITHKKVGWLLYRNFKQYYNQFSPVERAFGFTYKISFTILAIIAYMVLLFIPLIILMGVYGHFEPIIRPLYTYLSNLYDSWYTFQPF